MNKILLRFSKQYCTKPPTFVCQLKANQKSIPKDIWAEEADPRWTRTAAVEGRWEWVERLFPRLRIPEPPKHTSTTGWRAPREEAASDLPYYVERSKNHMLPVYQNRVYKDRVLVTQIDRVQGDIWVFERDLKRFLEKELSQKIESHVNEMGCFVNVKGLHVERIKGWLYDKGF